MQKQSDVDEEEAVAQWWQGVQPGYRTLGDTHASRALDLSTTEKFGDGLSTCNGLSRWGCGACAGLASFLLESDTPNPS